MECLQFVIWYFLYTHELEYAVLLIVMHAFKIK